MVECYSGIIVYSDSWDRNLVEVCGEPRESLDVVEVHNPEIMLDLIEWFSKEYIKFAALVKILIENDLQYLVGTHSAMDRTLARLKKFHRILKQLSIPLKNHGIGCGIGLDKLFIYITRDLETALNALEFFKDDIHRIRDRAHELIYPYLRRALERLLEVEIIYMPYRDTWRQCGDERYIVCEFRANRLDNELEYSCKFTKRNPWVRCKPYELCHSKSFSRYLSIKEVKQILEKQIKRAREHEEQSRIYREYIACLEKEPVKICNTYFYDNCIFRDPWFSFITDLEDFIKQCMR
ncbi:hypothetical protein J4526_01490 [Desulfurococcaceae archaeon MEX13E-LK6-19]|nr:hypothetical protein J4526_01490 [Desulfurococcaceae archaeon MEX13E-LK6-19]